MSAMLKPGERYLDLDPREEGRRVVVVVTSDVSPGGYTTVRREVSPSQVTRGRKSRIRTQRLIGSAFRRLDEDGVAS